MGKLLNYIANLIPFSKRKSIIHVLHSNLNSQQRLELGRPDVFAVLNNLKANDFSPATVIDIGAHNGLWTKEVKTIFPGAAFYLFEALPGKHDIIKKNLGEDKVFIRNVLLGDENKTAVPFFSMETGSSVLEEVTNFPRDTIYLDMVTLDNEMRSLNITQPVLMKLDAQGFELNILRGAENFIRNVELICMEASLLNYNKNAPLAAEVIQTMLNYGFVIYDIAGFSRKSNDNSLIQADFIFIREDAATRKKANDFSLPFSVWTS